MAISDAVGYPSWLQGLTDAIHNLLETCVFLGKQLDARKGIWSVQMALDISV